MRFAYVHYNAGCSPRQAYPVSRADEAAACRFQRSILTVFAARGIPLHLKVLRPLAGSG